ncbi:MAG TPA: serine hydrolase domain-containing protein [Phycisphaerae bacterium]|nr:serine hydrolase domain-containing protein [Phycisphaerae bacterium]
MNPKSFLVLLLFAGAAAAQAEPRRIDDLLKPIVEKQHVPGMVAALVEGDHVTAIGAAGVRKNGGEKAVTIDDQFHLGSDTKAMTATLIGMLVEEGKLSWTSTMSELFPDLADNMHPDWQKVTVEQLLTHQAGAPAHLETAPIWGKLWNFKGPLTKARRDVVEYVLSRPPEAQPGTKFIYSNAGYVMAGAIIEKITNKPWEDFIRERLFEPLGMKSAGFGAPGERKSESQPWGHSADGAAISPGPRADNPPAIGPAGTVHCNITDWAKFISLHLTGEKGGSKLLKAETFKKLHTPVGKYAMGWGVDKRDWAGKSGRVLHHAGSNTMWFAVVWIAPDENFAVLVMCNKADPAAQKACDQAVQALIHERAKGNPVAED